MDNLFGVISSSSDDSEATYSDAPTNSDVEEDVEVEAGAATANAVRSPPEKHLRSQFDVADTAQETTAPPVERMKNDLAAELVLSPDSNDNDDDDDDSDADSDDGGDEGVRGNLSTEEIGDFYPLRNASGYRWDVDNRSPHYYLRHTTETHITLFFECYAAV
ncbi:hypothetical protein TSMEX_001492 [Taenia solium]|eukprot:TsM_000427600 transcript=TsM_000427600 gene=TsM_000427600